MDAAPSTAAVMERERLTAEVDVVAEGGAAAEPSSFVVKIRRRLPDFARSVNLKYVRLGMRSGGLPAATSWVPLALAPPLLAAAVHSLVGVEKLYSLDLLTCVAWLGAAALLLIVYFLKRPRPVYLVDFACYRPDDEHSISKEGFLEMTESTGFFNTEALEFQTKITRRSGLGDRTYLPPGIQARPPRLSMAEARAEAEAVMFGCLDKLFASTGVDPRRDVRVLIVNCSLFNPTPSLASMVVHRYRMREDVKSFNLGGMGCSAGLIAVDLARDMLQANPGCYAVVVSTENITLNWYFGNDRSMLLSTASSAWAAPPRCCPTAPPTPGAPSTGCSTRCAPTRAPRRSATGACTSARTAPPASACRWRASSWPSPATRSRRTSRRWVRWCSRCRSSSSSSGPSCSAGCSVAPAAAAAPAPTSRTSGARSSTSACTPAGAPCWRRCSAAWGSGTLTWSPAGAGCTGSATPAAAPSGTSSPTPRLRAASAAATACGRSGSAPGSTATAPSGVRSATWRPCPPTAPAAAVATREWTAFRPTRRKRTSERVIFFVTESVTPLD